MPAFIRNLFTSAADLLTDDRQRSVRKTVWLLGFIAVAVFVLVGAIAGRGVGAEHPLWEVSIKAKIAIIRLVMAIPVVLVGAATGVVLFQLLENTDLGVRLTVPLGSDDAHSEAQKVRNGGTLLSALIGACVLGFLLAVIQ